MATVPQEEVSVILGVDTHEEVHVVVALDQLGRRLGELSIPTHRGGFVRLVDWASQFGVIDRIGVEGTGSWGAGLSRWLRAEGLVVVEGRTLLGADLNRSSSWMHNYRCSAFSSQRLR